MWTADFIRRNDQLQPFNIVHISIYVSENVADYWDGITIQVDETECVALDSANLTPSEWNDFVCPSASASSRNPGIPGDSVKIIRQNGPIQLCGIKVFGFTNEKDTYALKDEAAAITVDDDGIVYVQVLGGEVYNRD